MNNQWVSTTGQKIFFTLGAALAIVGSFLPWEVWGDLFPVWEYGIHLSPVFIDNGGMAIVLLSACIIWFALWPPAFAKYPLTSIMIVACGLIAISAYHVIGWLSRRIAMNGIIGAPELEIGLMLVCIGSLLIIVTGMWNTLFGKMTGME